MELPGFELTGPTTSTPYADVRTGRRLADGVPVRVERLRTTDPAVRDRLTALAGPLRRVDGRHVVRVREVLTGDVLAVVRDDVPGEPATAPLPVDRAVQVVADVLDALAGLHAAGLVHGALTPADVLLDASVPLRTTTRLSGYGLAAALTPARPVPADDVAAAGRLLVELTENAPEAAALAAALLDPDLARRPSAADARDALRRDPAATRTPRRAAPVTPAAPATSRRRAAPPARRVLPVAAAVVVAAAVLALGVLLGRLLAGDDQPALPPVAGPARPAAPYVFAAVQRVDGLVVERTWMLEDGGAVLRGTTVTRNPTLLPISAGIDEVVPKSVAEDVDDLVFRPGPDAIVERDPVVRFNVVALAPGSSIAWEFAAKLPRAVEQSALPRLAADAETARRAYEQRLADLRAGPAPSPPGSPAPGAPGPSPTS